MRRPSSPPIWWACVYACSSFRTATVVVLGVDVFWRLHVVQAGCVAGHTLKGVQHSFAANASKLTVVGMSCGLVELVMSYTYPDTRPA